MSIRLFKPALAPIRLALAVVFILSGVGLAAAQGRRVALVIGNGAYRNVPPLANPRNDATLMAQTLQNLGFKLVGGGARIDLDKVAFDAAVRAFGQEVRGAEVALFYYSGHGMQVQGSNWLVPLDANPTRVQDLDFQMVDAQLVLRQMEGAGTKLNLMILDACRNNPFGGSGLRATDSGLAQMRAPEGTLISYATQPGNTAADGTGQNSPYTQALAETMRQPGLDVLRMFNRVGVEVKKATGGVQQPWVSSSPLETDYYMAGPASNTVPAIPALSPVVPQPVQPPPVPAKPARANDITRAMVGNWTHSDGAACTPNHVGIVDVRNGRLYFEWRWGTGRPNLAIERIDNIYGNVIETTVESDENTRTPEVGNNIRYTVEGDTWISTNLSSGKSYRHKKC
jgi:hypothetical protein